MGSIQKGVTITVLRKRYLVALQIYAQGRGADKGECLAFTGAVRSNMLMALWKKLDLNDMCNLPAACLYTNRKPIGKEQ